MLETGDILWLKSQSSKQQANSENDDIKYLFEFHLEEQLSSNWDKE
jgi:hypothetical protein